MIQGSNFFQMNTRGGVHEDVIWPQGRPRGHILKSLALASKVKSLTLASRPQVLKNCPVLGSRTALFFELLKFCGALEKLCGKLFLWRWLEKFL